MTDQIEQIMAQAKLAEEHLAEGHYEEGFCGSTVAWQKKIVEALISAATLLQKQVDNLEEITTNLYESQERLARQEELLEGVVVLERDDLPKVGDLCEVVDVWSGDGKPLVTFYARVKENLEKDEAGGVLQIIQRNGKPVIYKKGE